MARILQVGALLILNLLSCGGQKVSLSPQELSGEVGLLAFFEEKDSLQRRAAFSYLQNTKGKFNEKMLFLKPLEGRFFLNTARADLLVFFSGTIEETEAMLRELENSPFGKAFRQSTGILLYPMGLEQNYRDLSIIVATLEKRYPTFTKLPLPAKEKIIQSENKYIEREIASIALGSYLCFSNLVCDSLRLVGFTNESSYRLFSMGGIYRQSLRKSPETTYFALRVLTLQDLTLY